MRADMFCAASEMGYVDEGSEDCRDLVHSYRNRLQEPSEYALLVRSLVSTLRHFPMSDMRSVFRAIAPHRRPIVVISGDEDATCPYQGAQEIAAMVAGNLVTVHGARHGVYREFKGHASLAC